VRDSVPDLAVLQALQRERLKLQQLESQGGAWLARLRQRRKVRRANKALAWSKIRLLGQESFVLRRGLLTHGSWTFAASLLGWFIWGGVHTRSDALDGVFLALFCGAIAGGLGGIVEWDRREREFGETVAGNSATLDDERSASP